MKAITELRKTGWVLITDDDGSTYVDDEGNTQFTSEIAMAIGRTLRVMPQRSAGGLRDVVTGYVTGDPS
jgi:hypothetical protein